MYKKFIDEYVPKSNPTYSLLYLYALRFFMDSSPIPSITDMANDLRLIPSDAYSAWIFWVSQGLATIDGDEVILTELMPKASSENGESDAMLEWLCNQTSQQFGGSLTASDMQTLVWIYSELKLDPYVTNMLICYARGNGSKKGMKYIQKTAIDWKEKHIDTVDKADEFIKRLENRGKGKKITPEYGVINERAIKATGFSNFTPSGTDYDAVLAKVTTG